MCGEYILILHTSSLATDILCVIEENTPVQVMNFFQLLYYDNTCSSHVKQLF